MSKQPKLRTRREVVRRRRRERQILVFGVVLIAVGAIGYAAMSVYSGEAEGPFAEPFVTPVSGFESDTRLVCPPNDVPLPPEEVVVRTMNGTDRNGLAGGVARDLEGRGFYTVGATNWNRTFDGVVRIYFGPGDIGVHRAWTLSLQFEEAELVLDNRDNDTVDLILGERYDLETTMRPLLAPELDPTKPLAANAPCLPANLVIAEPAPRILAEDPLAPSPSPSPSASASATPSDETGD